MRHSATADDVVNALDDLTATDAKTERSALSALGIGPNDARVLRHLLDKEPTGETVTPRDLSTALGISSAATTALLDRLADAGWIVREPHPDDRRSIVIRGTVPAGSPARRWLSVRRVSVAYAAAKLGASDRRVLVDFIDELTRAQEHYLDEARKIEPAASR